MINRDKKILHTKNLVEASVISVMETPTADGKNYQRRYRSFLDQEIKRLEGNK